MVNGLLSNPQCTASTLLPPCHPARCVAAKTLQQKKEQKKTTTHQSHGALLQLLLTNANAVAHFFSISVIENRGGGKKNVTSFAGVRIFQLSSLATLRDDSPSAMLLISAVSLQLQLLVANIHRGGVWSPHSQTRRDASSLGQADVRAALQWARWRIQMAHRRRDTTNRKTLLLLKR